MQRHDVNFDATLYNPVVPARNIRRNYQQLGYIMKQKFAQFHAMNDEIFLAYVYLYRQTKWLVL